MPQTSISRNLEILWTSIVSQVNCSKPDFLFRTRRFLGFSKLPTFCGLFPIRTEFLPCSTFLCCGVFGSVLDMLLNLRLYDYLWTRHISSYTFETGFNLLKNRIGHLEEKVGYYKWEYSWQKMCRLFFPNQPILQLSRHQLGVLQFNSFMTLMALEWTQPPQVRNSATRCLRFRHQLKCKSLLLTNGL